MLKIQNGYSQGQIVHSGEKKAFRQKIVAQDKYSP
jgi:hypothetical protein